MPKALIVGAGINGLASAWGLVRADWQVEVFEAGDVPNPLAASTDHHRLIRAFYSDPGYAARIRRPLRLGTSCGATLACVITCRGAWWR